MAGKCNQFRHCASRSACSVTQQRMFVAERQRWRRQQRICYWPGRSNLAASIVGSISISLTTIVWTTRAEVVSIFSVSRANRTPPKASKSAYRVSVCALVASRSGWSALVSIVRATRNDDLSMKRRFEYPSGPTWSIAQKFSELSASGSDNESV